MTLTTDQWIQLSIAVPIATAFVLTVVAALIRAVRWLISIGNKLNIILKEVTPNSGHSIKDRVMKLEQTQQIQLDALTGLSESNHRIESQLRAVCSNAKDCKHFTKGIEDGENTN